MKMFAGALKKKKDEKSQQVAEYISKSYDISDVKFIEPVVTYLRGEKGRKMKHEIIRGNKHSIIINNSAMMKSPLVKG